MRICARSTSLLRAGGGSYRIIRMLWRAPGPKPHTAPCADGQSIRVSFPYSICPGVRDEAIDQSRDVRRREADSEAVRHAQGAAASRRTQVVRRVVQGEDARGADGALSARQRAERVVPHGDDVLGARRVIRHERRSSCSAGSACATSRRTCARSSRIRSSGRISSRWRPPTRRGGMRRRPARTRRSRNGSADSR